MALVFLLTHFAVIPREFWSSAIVVKPVVVGLVARSLSVGFALTDMGATSPDAAAAEAIEYFHIEPARQFRVLVTKLDKMKVKIVSAS
jgi:hypothetical protein